MEGVRWEVRSECRDDIFLNSSNLIHREFID